MLVMKLKLMLKCEVEDLGIRVQCISLVILLRLIV